METIYAVALVIVSYVGYAWLSGIYNSVKKYPPSPIGLPVVGNVVHFFSDDWTGRKLWKKIGGTYMIRIFTRRIIHFCTWEDIKEAFVNQGDVFYAKEEVTDKQGQEMVNYGFLYIHGPVSKEKRRFTLQHMRNVGIGKTEMENVILQDFQRVATLLDKQQRLRINDYFLTPFINIIMSIVANKTYEFDDEELLIILDHLKIIAETVIITIIYGAFPPVKYIPKAKRLLKKSIDSEAAIMAIIYKYVDEHEKFLGDGEPRDYIDAYLMEIRKNAGSELADRKACYTKKHLAYGIKELIIAGIETTATTMEWCLLYMATWPEIQKKVQKEIDAVIGRSRSILYSDREMLHYTRAVIMEAQRYSTVVQLHIPRVASKTTMVNNYLIPRNSLVLGNIYAIHFDKKRWGDPEIFRPERFLNADGKAVKLDGWMPFSLGARVCVGESLAQMSLFLYFTGLMQRYSFRILTGHTPPKLEPVMELTCKPAPVELSIRLR